MSRHSSTRFRPANEAKATQADGLNTHSVERGASTAGARRRESALTLAVCAGLVVLIFAVFSQTLGYDFVNFDDRTYVVENPHMSAGLTLSGVVWAFTRAHASNWHPLTWLSHALDCQLYGLRPAGHHLTSVFLHAATAILLFLVLRRMTAAPWPSAFVAAVFAIHPLRAESVAWIAERKDVLCGFFWVLAMGAYRRYAERPSSLGRYSAVAAALALALLAKPMAVTLPFVLLLLDYWPLKRYSGAEPHGEPPRAGAAPGAGQVAAFPARRLIAEKVPLLALVAVSCVVTFVVQNRSGAVHGAKQIPVAARAGNAMITYVSYIADTLFPTRLAVFYPYPLNGLAAWKVAGAVTILAVISLAVLMLARQRPYLAVGWLWYLGTLVPVIGFVQVGEQAMADRYTYLPAIGLAIMLAWSGQELARRSRAWRKALAPVAVASVLGLAAIAWGQTHYWKDSITLFTHAIAVTQDNYLAYNNLGEALMRKGKLDEAFRNFNQSSRIAPDYPDALNNMGSVLGMQGKNEEAIECFSKSLRANPGNENALYNLACAYDALGRQDDAIHYYEEALRSAPERADAHNNLGMALQAKGELDRAIEHFIAAVRYQPDYAEAHCNWAGALRQKGQAGEAMRHYREALRLAEASGNRALVSQIQQEMSQGQ